jgi:23S rRNA-/tRNA-specific pseudouridylate synthase
MSHGGRIANPYQEFGGLSEPIRLRAGPEDAGKRLDQVVHERLPQYSRARIQQWIRDGRVRVNGAPARARAPCGRENPSSGTGGSPAAPRRRPKTFPLQVLYEDATWWPSISRPAWWCTPARAFIRERW